MGPHVPKPSKPIAPGRSRARFFQVFRTHRFAKTGSDLIIRFFKKSRSLATSSFHLYIFRDPPTAAPLQSVKNYDFRSSLTKSAHVDPSLNRYFLPQTTPEQSEGGEHAFLTCFDAFCACFTPLKCETFRRKTKIVTIMQDNRHHQVLL